MACTGKATRCTYSVKEGKTPQQASREQGKAYKAVLRVLRDATARETSIILEHLRDHEDLDEAVICIHAATLPIDCRANGRVSWRVNEKRDGRMEIDWISDRKTDGETDGRTNRT